MAAAELEVVVAAEEVAVVVDITAHLVALPAPCQPECHCPFTLFLKISSSHLIRDEAPSGKNLLALS
jgi:hypothetical protein